VCQNSHSPTQENRDDRTRCPHGYYVHARKLGTPRCRTCDPMSQPLEGQYISYALALLALRNAKGRGRRRNLKGSLVFDSEATVGPGEYRCWRCRKVLPLDDEHFRRQASKATGHVSRCKPCDNALRSARRRGDTRPGVQALIDVGVRL
jgi:hypothetical protein